MWNGKPFMSEAGGPPRDWRFYIQDMIGFSERVLSYTEGMDRTAFLADVRTYDATLRNLELIGEAATHIPEAIRDTHPEIPWRAIVGARNRLAHGYLHIDNNILWSLVEDAVPQLLPALRELLETPERDRE